MQKTITKEDTPINTDSITKPLRKALLITTYALIFNLLLAVIFVLYPSYNIRIAGYFLMGIGLLAIAYALYLINLSLNRASDAKAPPPKTMKHFLGILAAGCSIYIFHLNYQGEIPYITQNIKVTVVNTSYAPVSELSIHYGGQKKTIKDIKQNEPQKFNMFKSNGEMKVTMKDKVGERKAEFSVSKEDFRVLLRIDWQRNIMPDLK